MTILLVIENLKIGGAQIAVLRLASALGKNHNVLVYDCFPDVRDNQLVTTYEGNYSVCSVSEFAPVRWMLWKLNALFKLFGVQNFFQKANDRRLRAVINNNSVEVVHSHMINADLSVGRVLATTNGKVAWLVTLHGCYEHSVSMLEGMEIPSHNQFLYHHLSKVDGFIYLTESNLRPIRHIFTQGNIPTIKMLNNVVSKGTEQVVFNRNELSISQEAVVFAMVARGVKEKGWVETIKAFLSLLEETSNDLHLVLAGYSPFVQTLKRKYKHPNVHFIGSTNSVFNLLRIADVGVLPSYTESRPNSIIEYISSGLAIIASNVGDVSKMISRDHYAAGVLIELRNGKPSIAELKERMALMVNNQNALSTFKKHALIIAMDYSEMTVAREHVNYYQEVI